MAGRVEQVDRVVARTRTASPSSSTEMPRCFSISIQSDVAWRALLRAFTVPAIWIAPPNSSSFSVSVVLPASGCEMMANVRRVATSRTRSAEGAGVQGRGNGTVGGASREDEGGPKQKPRAGAPGWPAAPGAITTTENSMKLGWMAGIAMALDAGGGVGEEVGCTSTTFRVFGANDRICVYAFDDPRVPGVACHISQARTGGISGSLGLAEDPSRFSIACRQVGPDRVARQAAARGERVQREHVGLLQEHEGDPPLRREAQHARLRCGQPAR